MMFQLKYQANFFRRGCYNSRRTTKSFATAPLAEMHKEFLDLVGEFGEGRVILNMQRYKGVAELIIDQPARRNAMSGVMMRQLAVAVDKISQVSCSEDGHTDDFSSQPVGLIIRGTGGDAFCAGADLGLVGQVVNTPERGAMMSAFMTDALNRLRQSALISVACLNGTALGGGAEIATAADFRIQPSSIEFRKLFAENSSDISGQLKKVPNFTVQFVHAKIGASPGWGGARRLVNIVGRRNALQICASAMPVPAEEGKDMGLIDAILEPPPILLQIQQRYDNDHATVAEIEDFCNDYYSEAGYNFLQPFVSDMVFDGSVRAIKVAIASVEDESSIKSKEIEQLMFRKRWFGKDNMKGLHSSPLNFFKNH